MIPIFGDIVCRDWHVSRDMDRWMHQQRAVQDTRLKDQKQSQAQSVWRV